MALVRWEPARELQSLQQEMNRLFGTFFDAPTASAGRQWLPAMDLVETDHEYVLRADLPGVSEDDVKIELEDSVLTISGERAAEHEQNAEGYYRVERVSGSFARSLTLPAGVDSDRIHANFTRGVLEVRIPKPERPQPRRISIAPGDEPTTIDATENVEGAESQPEEKTAA